MGRSRLTLLKILGIVLVAFSGGSCDCDDDDKPTGPKLVTVRGAVTNIDTQARAAGVKVSLYGTSYADGVVTGSDGRYSISVPEGSTLLLYTDDFVSTTDVWFPLLNCDVPALNVSQLTQAERDDWPIHACPQPSVQPGGSVALWDDFLANVDDQTYGNAFAARSSANASGIVSSLFGDCVASTWMADSFSLAVNTPSFPVGYWVFGATSGATLMQPQTSTVTDPGQGIALAFGDSASAATSVRLTFIDAKAGRGIAWQPYDCPIRKGMISLVWPLATDGVPNSYWRNFGRCVGLLTGPALTNRKRGATP